MVNKTKKTATNKCHNPNVLNNIFLNLVLTLNYSFKLDCVKKNGLMMLSKTKKGTNLKKIDLSRSVKAEGFEPSTACLEGRCSIQLSYASIAQ